MDAEQGWKKMLKHWSPRILLWRSCHLKKQKVNFIVKHANNTINSHWWRNGYYLYWLFYFLFHFLLSQNISRAERWVIPISDHPATHPTQADTALHSNYTVIAILMGHNSMPTQPSPFILVAVPAFLPIEVYRWHQRKQFPLLTPILASAIRQ